MTSRITRRDLLKLGALGMASAALTSCVSARPWTQLDPYVRPPEEQLAGVATWYASTCRQCPAGCGIIVRVMNGRALKIEGNPEHPLNQGKLCARGQAGLQVLYNPDRLAGPVRQPRRGTRQYEPISWEEGLGLLGQQLQAAGSAIAIWADESTSGHLYDMFQRFSQAVGARPPLVYDQYTALHGYDIWRSSNSQFFGQASLPALHFSQADVVLSFGADLLGPSLSQVRYGVEFGSFRGRANGQRGYLVQMEPRMTITGAKADRWLPIQPGTEALVAQALARLIGEEGQGPADRVARARTWAPTVDVGAVADISGVSVDEMRALAALLANADRPLAIPGDALTGQADPLPALAAVEALNVIAGATGPSGGLELDAPAPLSSLVRPTTSSFAQVQDLLQAMRGGQVRALLVYGANPLYDLAGLGVDEALAQVPLVVSFSPIVDETAVLADLILPDGTYLESWGYDLVSPNFGVPIVGSQQAVVQPYLDTRPTANVLLDVARGIPAAAAALPWADEMAYLQQEIGQLPPGAFGGSGAEVLLSRFLQHGGWWPASPPAPAPLQPAVSTVPPVSLPEFQGSAQEYPYYLRIFTSDLLSAGRGASQPWLQGSPEPMSTISWQTWVEVHPETAQKLGLEDGDIVEVTSPYGQVEAIVYTYPGIRPDTVAIPTGQGHSRFTRYAERRGANPLDIVAPLTDRDTGALAWSATRVRLRKTGRHVNLPKFEGTVEARELPDAPLIPTISDE